MRSDIDRIKNCPNHVKVFMENLFRFSVDRRLLWSDLYQFISRRTIFNHQLIKFEKLENSSIQYFQFISRGTKKAIYKLLYPYACTALIKIYSINNKFEFKIWNFVCWKIFTRRKKLFYLISAMPPKYRKVSEMFVSCFHLNNCRKMKSNFIHNNV